MKNWQKTLEKIPDVRVLIVGDVMLDRYWWGSVSRISPEAPVPVVKLERESQTAGGAANVAANVASLGAQAFLVGAIGEDDAGRALPKILEQNRINSNLVRFSDRPTTTKTRIVAHHQHIVRIDDEESQSLDKTQAEGVWNEASRLIPLVDIVVLSDYAKGCLCDSVLEKVIERARELKKPVLVDPKGRNYHKYNGASLLTPNKLETAAASGIEITDAESVTTAGKKLLKELRIDSLLVTLGEDGMQLFEKGREPRHFPAFARDVYDVTGAGDTVIAGLAASLAAGADLAGAAIIANTAAGIAVQQVGTALVTSEQLEQTLQTRFGVDD
jgi:D-beta-D-heptose 7-phosphate kinase/D-beta-D-heptose 1-phosphate adenosyltransferase